MVEPDFDDPIANCPPGSRYDIFLKHRDLFDFPLESLEGDDDDKDGQHRDAAEFQDFAPFASEALLDFASGGIGVPAPSVATNLIVPKEEPHYFAEDASRGSFSVQIDHAASLVYRNNQAPSTDSVLNSNRSSSGEREISRSSNNLIEVSTDMTQSESSHNLSPARRSSRIASRVVNRPPNNSGRSLPRNIASCSKRPLQKKMKGLSQLSDATEVSQLCLQQLSQKKKCSHCGLTETPQWSDGPSGPNTLCNVCGIQFRCGLLDKHSAAAPTSDPCRLTEFREEAVYERNQAVLGANMAPYKAIKHEPVAEIEPEVSQSSVRFNFHPLADKANLSKRNLNKKAKPPQMTQTSSGSGDATTRKCLHCEVVETTQWREGPMGPRTLCNACGLRYRSGRLCPEYRPANSPTFVPSIHSCLHREVVKIRRKVTKKASFSQEGPSQPLSDSVKEAAIELPVASSTANEEATIAGTEPSMSSLKDMEEVAMINNGETDVSGREATTSLPKTIKQILVITVREPPILQPKVVGEASMVEAETAITNVEKVAMSDIRDPMLQCGGSVPEFPEAAYRIERIMEKVKKMKNRLSKLPVKGGVKKKLSRRSTLSRKCLQCEATKTPQWRDGPLGPKTLCNACGMWYRSGRLLPEYRSSSSQEEANIVAEEPSMPLNSPFNAPREVVIGLVAEPLISPPPKVVQKTSMADTEGPMSQCAGSEPYQVKRVLKKKKKKSKKKQPKLSANGGVKKKLSQGSTMPGKCLHCESKKTPQWRDGPLGPKTLCNACGIRYRAGGLLPEYRPAASPVFVPSLHSNSHKHVIQMRKKDSHEEARVGTVTSSINQEAAVAKMEPQTPPPPEFTPTNSYSINSESADICSFS